MILSPLDVVFLNVDLPGFGLTKGQIGAVIDVYHSPSLAYEIEFCDEEGKTIASLALLPEQLTTGGAG
ncbi:DUF4926 domain-containing protein [Citrobacter youngae]|uniref:DUF4926 domain-containing protein n=1 Tax=Citrobacter youngae ATCC 29220 TaxID=500640 RepID=D4BFR8_9ENTR|nr:DUF4926 domain-containing protein [Citrobacter youngae]EFE07205.1 hypothetical protein CIT292_09088 [Citrobacter youngae ATCC 29220]